VPPGGACVADDLAEECCRGSHCLDGQCVTDLGTCAIGADYCADGRSFCNGGEACQCYDSLSGPTRCGQRAAGDCACSSDSHCDYLGIAGAFCARASGGGCQTVGCFPGNGFCAKPCPFAPAPR
jgi:hypothetical protein